MSCSCIPPPASLKPRKIYNLLVPDIFDSATVPDIAEPTSTNTLRKIGKLQEYVAKNPAKAGKASRRLSRRIKKALYDHQLGYVKVAVEAYCCLLKGSEEPDCSYTFSYFNKELVHQPDALISALLSYQKAEVKALGAQLLAEYVKAQSPTEHQASLVADLVSRVLKLCTATSAADSSTVTAKDMSAASPTELLRQACLLALSEYISFCQRLKILPQLLEQIEVGLLDSVEQDLAAGVPVRAPLVHNDGTVTYRAGSILGNFKPFLQDTSSVRRVVGTLLQWLDKNQRWENAALVQELVGVTRDACGGLTYPMTSAMLRHCADEPSLTPKQRAMVARLAVQQGPVYSLSAFNLALLELPRAILAAQRHNTGSASDMAELHTAAAEVCVTLARDVGHAGQVCEALATVLRAQLASSPESAAAQVVTSSGAVTGAAGPGAHRGAAGPELTTLTLECGLAVAQALHTLPEETRRLTGRQLPSALLNPLTTLLTSTGTHASGPAPTITGASRIPSLALRLLAALIPHLDGPLKDERQAVQLLACVSAVAENAGTQPLQPVDVAAASKLVHAAVASGRPVALLQAARTALSCAQQGLALEAVTGAAVQAAAVALLADSTAHQLAGAAQCPGLATSKVSPSLSLPDVAVAADATLHSTSTSWSDASSAAAQQAISGGALKNGLSAWQNQVKALLTAGGVLHTTWGSQLPELLEPPHASSQTAHSQAAPPGGATTPGSSEGSHVSRGLHDRLSNSRKWADRQISIRKERLNIARVMDILGGSEEEGGGTPQTGSHVTTPLGPGATAAVDLVDMALKSKPGVPLAVNGKAVPEVVTLQDVSGLIAAEVAAAEAAGAGPGLQTRDLVAQLAF